jgi:hypothetical protein
MPNDSTDHDMAVTFLRKSGSETAAQQLLRPFLSCFIRIVKSVCFSKKLIFLNYFF